MKRCGVVTAGLVSALFAVPAQAAGDGLVSRVSDNLVTRGYGEIRIQNGPVMLRVWARKEGRHLEALYLGDGVLIYEIIGRGAAAQGAAATGRDRDKPRAVPTSGGEVGDREVADDGAGETAAEDDADTDGDGADPRTGKRIRNRTAERSGTAGGAPSRARIRSSEAEKPGR